MNLRRYGLSQTPVPFLRANRAHTLATFAMPAAHRAWQGVAVDVSRDRLYVLTSFDETFDLADVGVDDAAVIASLENIITVFDLDGNLITTHRDASTAVDSGGRLMGFGDGNVIGDSLYVAVFNGLAGGPSPYESAILQYDLDALATAPTVHDIGTGAVEGVALYDGSFWTCYFESRTIKRWSSAWVLEDTFTLTGAPENLGDFGEYQTIEWRGASIYVNLHGGNTPHYARQPYMHVYDWNGTGFTFSHEIKPPTSGCGQGVAWFGSEAWWVDRPANTLVRSVVVE